MGRVLPGVEQRVGHRVLLLHCDLVDDEVGQARVVEAIGAAPCGLVGLLLAWAFEGFGHFLFFLFFRGFRFEFFNFFFRFLLLFLLFLDRFARRIEASVLAGEGGGLIGRGELTVAEPSGGPGDRRVQDRVRVTRSRVGGADGRVVAAEAFRGGRVARAVRRARTAIDAHGHARRGKKVEDRAHALLKSVLRDEGRELFADLFVGEAGDLVARLHRVGVFAPGPRVKVRVRVGPPEGGLIGGALVGLVPVLRIHGEDIAQRAAVGADRLQEAVDHALPVAVVAVRRVPVDGVRVVRVHHGIAAGVRELGPEFAVPVEDRFLVARLGPYGRPVDRFHDGAGRRRGEHESGPDARHQGGGQRKPARGRRSAVNRQGERASEDGHEPIIGRRRGNP